MTNTKIYVSSSRSVGVLVNLLFTIGAEKYIVLIGEMPLDDLLWINKYRDIKKILSFHGKFCFLINQTITYKVC